ncbi:hypothetical protein [Alteriqipengyuania lutimaris]|nr:hypothetical protein [Alteriqipengyuania lutimaris]MBB3034049.1 hypothetical protein [Alteriqipengyuania lutimaris]
MSTKKYTVLKAQTDGTKDYARGDTRTMSEADAKPLIDMGALEEGAAARSKVKRKAADPATKASKG